MEKQSLQDMWDEATDRFQNLTGRNLRLKPAKTLDDVRREMEAQQSQADASDDRDAKSRASQRNMNLLYGLKVIGGVVAQGASMVFGPADLCFNAISLLIDIPRKIHTFYAAVDGLFEEVSQNCWEQLRAEKFFPFVCNAKHNWLHVPEWDDGEHMRIGKGNVKIGGEFKDGARVGGEIVPVEQWLDLLRDEWGIPKTKREGERDKKPKGDS